MAPFSLNIKWHLLLGTVRRIDIRVPGLWPAHNSRREWERENKNENQRMKEQTSALIYTTTAENLRQGFSTEVPAKCPVQPIERLKARPFVYQRLEPFRCPSN